jgi:hypothetical protein
MKYGVVLLQLLHENERLGQIDSQYLSNRIRRVSCLITTVGFEKVLLKVYQIRRFRLHSVIVMKYD